MMNAVFKINCLFCNKEYLTSKKRIKFCSRSCGSKWNHKNNNNFKISINNLIRNDKPKIKKICETCNITYFVQNKRKNKSRFCSKRCRSSWIIKIHGTKLIEAAKAVCSGRIAPNRGVPHKPEALDKIVNSTLSRGNGIFGIKYDPFVDKNKRRHNMKSSWEIVFALNYLDENNIEWYYEPKKFTLSDGKMYVPDFYDKTNNLWYELKGLKKEGFLEKFTLFKKENPDISIQLLDNKEMIQRKFNIDMTSKYLKKIIEQYRRKDEKDKIAHYGRPSVDLLTSGIVEKFTIENPEYAGNS